MVTLNVNRVVCVISPNSLAFGTYYVKVVEGTRIQFASEMYPNNLVFNDVSLMAIFAGNCPPNGGINVK